MYQSGFSYACRRMNEHQGSHPAPGLLLTLAQEIQLM